MLSLLIAKLAFLLIFGVLGFVMFFLLSKPTRQIGPVERLALAVGMVCLVGMAASEAVDTLHLVRQAGAGTSTVAVEVVR